MVFAYKSIMGFNRTIILADDLTGANDTAIQFANQGLSSLVLTHADSASPSSFGDYEVIALNSGSRGMKPPDAYRAARDLVARFKTTLNGGRLYKKVDSVLRGNPAAELSAVMDELDIPLALVAPSFPANQSTLEGGILDSGSAHMDALGLFSREMEYEVEGVALEEIRRGHFSVSRYILDRHTRGTRVFVADALTDEDLEILYRSSLFLGKPVVLAGAAALARHMARDMGQVRGARNFSGLIPRQPGSPVLVIAGTRQGETAAQLTTLSRILSVPIIRFKVDLVRRGREDEAVSAAFTQASAQIRDNQELLIVAVESMFTSEIPAGVVDRFEGNDDQLSAAISAALGTLAAKLLDAFRFPALITTGGDTSLDVCRSMNIEGIEPVTEICPGIPLGKIAGGPYEGQFIITKSGRFGNQGSLLEILRFIGMPVKGGVL
jgi:uncharacterized protein YgbK (DUF1537 family)